MSASKRIITLTTDWGIKDHYVAAVKAKIYSKLNDVIIIDITHSVELNDVFSAAHILKSAIRDFPENTIHIIGVKAEATKESPNEKESLHVKESPHVVVCHNNVYFIGADNGFFNYLFDKKPDKVFKIDIHQDTNYWGFPTKNVFVKVAAEIVKNNNLSNIGFETELQNTSYGLFYSYIKDDTLIGKIVHIDHYGNCITNIPHGKFLEFTKRKKYRINFDNYEVTKTHKTYIDQQQGEFVCFFNSLGFLEIAINAGNIQELLGLKIKDDIIVYIEN